MLKGFLHEKKTSNLAKVRFQLYPAAAVELMAVMVIN